MAQLRSVIASFLQPIPSKAGSWPWFRNPVQHPFRLLVTVILTAIGILEWTITPPTTFMNGVCAAVSLTALLLAGIFPVPCNLIVVLNFCVTCLFFVIEGPSQLLAVSYSICALTYDTIIWLGIVLCAPVIASMIIFVHRYPEFHWFERKLQTPILVMLLVVALIFSIIARQNSLYGEMSRRAEQAEDLQRRVEVARLVHDSVTGDLANIARIAQRQTRLLDESDSQRKVWEQVNNRSVRVLDNVYAVIRQLDGTAGDSDIPQQDSDERIFAEVIQERAKDWEDKLDEAGLNGEFTIVDHVHAPVNYGSKDIVEQRRCFLDIMNEMFANIMKHGVPGDNTWQITATISADQLELVGVNRMFTSNMQDDQGVTIAEPVLPGGHGLKLHRERVESFGGVVIADTEDGQWMMYVRIPRTHVEYHSQK